MPNVKLAQVTSSGLVSIQFDELLEDAVALMKKYSIRHLPVVNPQKVVCGILSDRDILRASIPLVDADGMPLPGRLRFLQGAIVAQYMSTALRTVSDDASVQDAIDVMMREKISSCLVVNENTVVGIITYEDMMDLLNSLLSSPKGSLRSTVGSFIARSPLGEVSNILAAVGI
jgi:CBS domain-containing protein